MSKGNFKFFSVGQGLFHAGKIRIKDNECFSFIYDCGTKKTSILPNAIECCLHFFKDISCPDKKAHIDFLFVSHLHADHINGLKLLIQELRKSNITIKNIILPYVNVYQRVILLLEALKKQKLSAGKTTFFNTEFSEQDYIEFYKNPYLFLEKQFGEIGVSPDDSPSDDIPALYIVNPDKNYYIADKNVSSEPNDLFHVYANDYSTVTTEDIENYFKENPESSFFFDNSISTLSEKRLNLDYPFFYNNVENRSEDFFYKNKAYSKKKNKNLYFISDSFGIFVKNAWRFFCFNTPLPSANKKYIMALHKEYQNILKSLGPNGNIDDLFSTVNIRLLQKHYRDFSSDLNSTSLLIYHYPTSEKYKYLRNDSSFLLLGDINLNSYIANLNNNIKKSFTNFLSSRISSLQYKGTELSASNFVLAPHHGSDLSWNPSVFNLLCEPSFYVVSASVKSKKHPGIEFIKSFHSTEYLNVPKPVYSNSFYIFLPPSISKNCYLHRFENILLWCNEKQSIEIKIGDSGNYVQVEPS